MSKVILEMNIKEAKSLIEQMPLDEKIRLVKELEKEIWSKRMDKILNNIDERRKKYRTSHKQITQEVEKARQEFYAHRY